MRREVRAMSERLAWDVSGITLLDMLKSLCLTLNPLEPWEAFK